MRMSGLAVVKTAQGLLQAQVLKTKLESHGIPATLDYESAGPVYGLTFDGLGEVRVLVPVHLARRARMVLATRRAHSPQRRRRRAPMV